MAEKMFKSIIQLRRDTAANFDKIGEAYVPRIGEVVLVDTADNGLRAKVGNGKTTYSALAFADQNIRDAISSKVIKGYYFNGKFYTDSTYTVEVFKSVESIYIDSITNSIYTFDGTNFICIKDTFPTASDIVAGIAKLYNEAGQNTDGSMTQKSITDGVNSIKLDLDASDTECLILDLPWDDI